MAQIKIYYEPEEELLTVFWQPPRKHQLCQEIDNGIVIIKDEMNNEVIGVELLSYKPNDNRFDSVMVELGKQKELVPA
ncbi:MAG: hypothetical protein HY960_06040 [Ignavibacteriae bacterium]|nr:hypothetical protein [Ignavibacteriota bacterium]